MSARAVGRVAGGVLGAADLPGTTDVAQTDLVRRVEAGVGSEIPLRQRAKGLVDEAQPSLAGVV